MVVFSIAPLTWALPTAIFAGFATAYWRLAPKFNTERQRAYVLSTISSFTMTLVSLPFVCSYLFYGLETTYGAAQLGWMGALGRFGVVFFGTYLFEPSMSDAQLSIGYFKYPSQVGLLTGWIHHTVYIALMVYCYNTRQSPIFLIAGIMELPTFDLAVSNLFPALRNDLRFLSSFFFIRIAFHLVLFVDCLQPSARHTMDGAWTPLISLALAFAMHASWFHGGVAGYLKRAARAKAAQSKNMATAVGSEVDSVSVDRTHNKETKETNGVDGMYDSDPGTPDDSPLVTPHTPRTLPILSLPNLPNMPNMPNLPNLPNLPAMPQLPNLAHMPTVSIPSFSDLTAAINAREQAFGFKEAVKNRWEEQRDRFAEIRRGGGVGLNFSGLGLRRRAGQADGVTVRDADSGVEE